MSRPAETSNSTQQSRTAQDRHQQFLETNRRDLLKYLDGKMPVNAKDPAPLDFVERVLTQWHERFNHEDLDEPDGRERAFWFALYQFESLAEREGQQLHPYEKIMMKNLVEVRELLRKRQPLPEQRYMASRPNGR